eukprot:8547550-Pyramimonas_sp.AAC.1
MIGKVPDNDQQEGDESTRHFAQQEEASITDNDSTKAFHNNTLGTPMTPPLLGCVVSQPRAITIVKKVKRGKRPGVDRASICLLNAAPSSTARH